MESSPRYFIDLFTPETWREAAARRFEVTGFSERRRRYAARIRPGDIFVCYLTGRSRFVGALRATSEVYTDESRIWQSQIFPTRFNCELVVQVPEDQGIHLRDVQAQSSQPDIYNWIFRASPQEMPSDDSEWILSQLDEIARTASPVTPVQIEVGDEGSDAQDGSDEEREEEAGEADAAPGRAHTRIQWKLATLGRSMGLGVWIARNDVSATFNGERLGDMSIDELPFSYDATTQGTIERIDVLWVKHNRIEAAFEIESTTAIYSGLLRMADLLALQPSIEIPLYIVAPDERRHLVLREIRRPTFTRMKTPLHRICRYLAFSAFEEALDRYGDGVRYTRADFLESISEDVSRSE